MRVSTKLGIAALLTSAALGAVAAGFALPTSERVGWGDFTVHTEAAISANLLSLMSLATGIAALLYTAYKQLRREPDVKIAMEMPALSTAVPRQRFSLSAEFLLVLGLLALLFAVNFATAEIYPMAWGDEAGYADPAINLALGNGFTSSAWYNVYWGQFWSSYPPLYPLLLAPWIRWLGVHFTSIRLFNVVLISGAAIALWHYTVRSGLFPSMLGRITVVLLPLLGYGVSFTYRAARPDTLCALLAVLALNASVLPDPRWRAAALIAVGSLVPWAGLQFVAFAMLLAVLIGIWWPRPAVTVFLPLGVGVGLGSIALLGFYAANDSLYGFLAATVGSLHTIVGEIAHLVLLNDRRGLEHIKQLPALLPAVVFEDRSSVFVSTAAILLLISLRRSTGTVAFKASGFAVTAAFVIPILMEFAGNYWLYYTWMGLLTVGIATVVSLEASPRSPALLPARRLAIGCIGLALVIGLPVQLIRAYQDRGARDYDAVRAYVQSRVTAGDWVLVSDQSYFAAVELGAVPVLTQYATSRLAPGIPEDQRRRIKLFIVHPDEVNAAIDHAGGSWRPSGPAFISPQSTRLAWGEWRRYELVAYQRE